VIQIEDNDALHLQCSIDGSKQNAPLGLQLMAWSVTENMESNAFFGYLTVFDPSVWLNTFFIFLFYLLIPAEYCGIISSIVLHLALGQANITKLARSSAIPTIWIVSGRNVCLQKGQRTCLYGFVVARPAIPFVTHFFILY
jgi:hypothetical protein